MTEDHENDAKHIVEAQKNLWKLKDFFVLSHALTSCSLTTARESTRIATSSRIWRHFFAIISSVERTFLAFGHTYKDIDQTISQISERLHSTDEVTMSVFHENLRKTNNGRARVVLMTSMVTSLVYLSRMRYWERPLHFCTSILFVFISRGATKLECDCVKWHVQLNWLRMMRGVNSRSILFLPCTSSKSKMIFASNVVGTQQRETAFQNQCAISECWLRLLQCWTWPWIRHRLICCSGYITVLQ